MPTAHWCTVADIQRLGCFRGAEVGAHAGQSCPLEATLILVSHLPKVKKWCQSWLTCCQLVNNKLLPPLEWFALVHDDPIIILSLTYQLREPNRSAQRVEQAFFQDPSVHTISRVFDVHVSWGGTWDSVDTAIFKTVTLRLRLFKTFEYFPDDPCKHIWPTFGGFWWWAWITFA